jgi:hypothetical protein
MPQYTTTNSICHNPGIFFPSGISHATPYPQQNRQQKQAPKAVKIQETSLIGKIAGFGRDTVVRFDIMLI